MTGQESLRAARQSKRVLEQLRDDVEVAKQVPAKDANAGRMRPWLMISEVEALLEEHDRLRQWVAATVLMVELGALDAEGVEGIRRTGKELLDG